MRVISGSTVTTWSKMSASEAHRRRLAATGEPPASRQHWVGHDSAGHPLVGGEGSVSTTAARCHPPAPTARDAAVPPDALLHFGDERVRDRRLATDGRFLDASDSARTRVLAPCEQWPRSKR
jgi:hypothetical protein